VNACGSQPAIFVFRPLQIVGSKGAAFMKIQVKGRHVAVSEPLRDYAEEKLAKLHRVLSERHIDEVTRVELELIVEKGHTSADSQVAEATVFTRGPVMRARESSPDMYASIDLVTEKLQRQAKKYHDKVHHKALRHTAAKAFPPASPSEPPDDAVAAEALDAGSAEAEAVVLAAEVQTAPRPVAVAVELGAPGGNHLDEPHVVKSKQFALKPMSVDEATLQLELIGHSFFVFTNAETNDTNVVYRRNDGDYGLIEPVRQ
jgi:putative sigma-54 modulation protein